MSSSRASGSGSGRGGTERTLDATMRAPNATEPAVVVITEAPPVVVEEKKRSLILDPEKDLWVSTVDGRHQSPIIPIHVGPNPSTFYVHRAILIKFEYFDRALNGPFSEASSQTIRLPEEDPSIFHFIIAFLYEGTFVPIHPLSKVLSVPVQKGKARETPLAVSSPIANTNGGRHTVNDFADEIVVIEDHVLNHDPATSDSTDSASNSDDSAHSRRLLAIRRRRQQRAWEDRNRKELGRHRPDCMCASCVVDMHGPPCWHCGVPRARPTGPARPGHPPYWYLPQTGPPPPTHPNNINDRSHNIIFVNGEPHPMARRPGQPPPPPPPPPDWIGPAPVVRGESYDFTPEPRMSREDLRSWLSQLSLSVSVYICADRYLISGLKSAVARCVTDAFETAGLQAAIPGVLEECSRLWEACGSSSNSLRQEGEMDGLVKMVLARTGFLMSKLWREELEKTMEWWVQNPECAARIMREVGERREVDLGGTLPPMERLGSLVNVGGGGRPPPPPGGGRRRRGGLADD